MTEDEQWDFRDRVVKELRDQIGVTFVHQGRRPDQGFDCIGLPNYACLKHDFEGKIPLRAMRRCYRENPNPDDLREALEAVCYEMWPNEPMDQRIASTLPLDFLLMTNREGDPPTHVMTVVESDWSPVVIHTHPRLLRVTEHHLTGEWYRAVRGVFRLKVLVDG